MIHKLQIEEFITLARINPVLDVRSPGEFAHAHIPGAYSLPLFSDEERKIVGTIYKQQSKELAIKTGLDFFGIKMRKMVEEVEEIIAGLRTQNSNSQSPIPQTVLVHCWRGGMRSAGVAWLLDLYGFEVYTLVGGYKAFRNWVLRQFEKQYPLRIIGGYTGSGKTPVLKELAKKGEAIIDLEGIAHHKGSAFGDLGELAQPSPEMFENKLAVGLHALSTNNAIWLEDESRRIGDINMPLAFWQTMRAAPLYFLEVPFEERLNYITAEYGKFKQEDLVSSIMRIRKRLGSLNAKNAINFIIEGNLKEAFSILLVYYDKYYSIGLHDRNYLDKLLTTVPCKCVDATTNCEQVLTKYMPVIRLT